MHCYILLSDESLFTRVPPLMSLYIYSNMIIMVVDYYSSLTYEHLIFLDSEPSTCFFNGNRAHCS